MLQHQLKSSKIFLVFLFTWTLFNMVQAAFMELHADEAYYWLYSRFLDWGYFDHPPMVALFIKAGDLLSPSKFGLRLVTILTNTFSVYILWEIVKRYAENVWLFILLFSSILIFHIYGFITTPDSPLLFFSILFFYFYQRYAEEDKREWAMLLALSIALMLYSKYHAVLVILFTLLSNIKLLKRPSFWLLAGIAGLLFIPHLYWQYQNGYPSVYYHLFDRSAKPYRSEYTSDYILSQILIAGPLVGWFIYKCAVTLKPVDKFQKALQYNFYGILAFFLLSTFKGRVEPHWTLIAFPPVFILAYVYLSRRALPKWFEKLAIVNIAIIILARLALIIPIPVLKELALVKYYFGSKQWAYQLKEKAGDNFVILQGGFQEASLYDFYNRTTKGFSYDTRFYRKNQFDIWPLEDSLRNRKVYYINKIGFPADIKGDTLQTNKGDFYGTWINQTRIYQKVQITTENFTDNWKSGGLRTIKLKINNPYQDTISFSNKGEKWKCFLEYGYMKDGRLLDFKPVVSKFERLRIAPGQSAETNAIIRAPMQPGKYKLVFSIRTEPFPGSRNSKIISININ